MSSDAGVIFDVDGVLVGSGPAHAASWKLVARKHGVEMTDQQFRETFGRTSREIIAAFWGDVSPAAARQIDDDKESVYRDLVTGMLPLTIGVREMLSGLATAGLPLGVATSGPPENLDLVLDEGRLRPYFRALVHGRDVERGKPAPDCFLLAAQRLGLSPGVCVVVEDAPAGIEAALAAGMQVIGFVGTHPRARLQSCGAHAIADRLAEITPMSVRTLCGRARSS